MSTGVNSTLANLITTLHDGRKGFETAAADVKDPTVKSTFSEFARQREKLANELSSHLGPADESTEGSTAAAAHRGWINLKSALGGGEKAILAEAERGEDVAVKTFEDALKQPLPPGVAEVVRRQYGEVKAAHDRVRNLRDTWK